jgi:hypothetical protein
MVLTRRSTMGKPILFGNVSKPSVRAMVLASDTAQTDLTSLRRLELNAAITDEGLRNIRGLRHLEHLHLGGTRVTDAGLAHLTGLSALTSLSLPSDLTGGGLVNLEGLRKLTFLAIPHSQLNDEDLSCLCWLSDLEQLFITECPRIRDRGTECLGALKKLRKLTLDGGSVSV